MKSPSRFRRRWGLPLALAALTAAGLAAALVRDGLWDAFSWLTLAVPLFAVISLFRNPRA